jgi:hypothetical protein
MERKVRTIGAIGANGRPVLVDEYQEFIDATTSDSTTREWLPGMKRLELRSGGAVNFIDETTLQIVTTGERLTVD